MSRKVALTRVPERTERMTETPVTVEFEVHRPSEDAATAVGSVALVIAGLILILAACCHPKMPVVGGEE
jgi:hypothetical protein